MTEREQDRDLVGELLDIEEGLSEGAIAFIESLDRWLNGYPTLTPRQRSKATEILEEWKARG